MQVNINAASNVDAYLQMKEAYANIRGYTITNGKKIPLLYGFDIPDINKYWGSKLWGARTSEFVSAVKRWLPHAEAAGKATPYLVVPNYSTYWLEMYRIASALDAERMAPSRFSLVWQASSESVQETAKTVANAVKLTFSGDWWPDFDFGSLKWIMYGTLAVTAVYFLRKR